MHLPMAKEKVLQRPPESLMPHSPPWEGRLLLRLAGCGYSLACSPIKENCKAVGF